MINISAKNIRKLCQLISCFTPAGNSIEKVKQHKLEPTESQKSNWIVLMAVMSNVSILITRTYLLQGPDF